MNADLVFGLARMFETFRENFGEEGIRVSAISAMRLNGFWLRIPPLENPLNSIGTTRCCLPLGSCMNRVR